MIKGHTKLNIMKNVQAIILTCLFLFIGGMVQLQAQDLELPKKSPKASTSWTVGLTEVTVDYHSPTVNGREIWGALEPYDKPWRAGANEATTVEFSTDVTVERNKLAAGKYALFIVPKKDANWTVIFNKVHDQWGAYNYDEAQNALSVDIKPAFKKNVEERLTYQIVQQSMETGYIRLGWEKLRLYIRFRVDAVGQAKVNIEKALTSAEADKKWQIYANAADFLMQDEKELDQALTYAQESTKLFQHTWNHYILAKAQAAKGDFKGAVTTANKAVELGAEEASARYYNNVKDQIAASIAEWSGK